MDKQLNNDKMQKILIQIIVSLLGIFFSYGQQNNYEIKIGERLKITSNILNEEREVQVYLPPTYFFSEHSNFPVIYMIDGDYNFQYVTGLVELLSNVSGKIPECIVVGISDKGSTKYRQNCIPNVVKKRNGNATNYMGFISNELKPFIQKKFKTSSFDIIIGHSIGGLFVTNFFVEQPSVFDAFIAIDPALWVGNFELINRSKKTLKNRKTIDASYYISSSTAKGMGTEKFVKLLKNQFPENNHWKYYKFDNENHNSVGLPTIKQSLEHIFSDWSISENEFKSFKTVDKLLSHYKALSTKFSTNVSIPSYFLGNVIYYYFRHKNTTELLALEKGIKSDFPTSIDEFYNQLALNYFENKDYKEAIANYEKSIENNPLSFNAYDGIAKVYVAQKNYKDAFIASEKSLEIAKKCHARQWMMNQLFATLDRISAKYNEKH